MPRHGGPDKLADEVCRLYKKLDSQREVSKVLNIPVSVVRDILFERGLCGWRAVASRRCAPRRRAKKLLVYDAYIDFLKRRW